MREAFFALLYRDVRLAFKQDGGLGTAIGFFLIVVALFPFGLGPDIALLTRLAPGLLWTALLLSVLLTLDRLFAADHEDGSLDLMTMVPLPLELVVGAKATAHWLTTGVPLTLSTPLFGIVLNLDISAVFPLIATMLAGTLALSFVGAIGAALTLALRRGGVLTAVLVLPLYAPVLIFGVSAVEAAVMGPAPFDVPFAILVALALAAVVLAPWAAAAALRSSLS